MTYAVLVGVIMLACMLFTGFNNITIGALNYFSCGVLWGFLGVIDGVSLSIWLMLLLCFGFVCWYTPHYLGGGVVSSDLIVIICVFVGVMWGLVLTGDFLTSLILWEYLGVVSFFLIIFYLSYLSLRASVVTLVSSRLGDVGLFMIIALAISANVSFWLIGVCILLVVCTKSASFPLISWLLEAMRAPTPVSSLVHSSTLVAAGVWFSLRYDTAGLLDNEDLLLTILVVSVVFTAVPSMFFFDLKKIVALSTSNNINWCLIYVLVGGVWLGLFQLICHGVSKCLLFMLVGDVMSGVGGSQASNFSYSAPNYGGYGAFGLVCIILGLSGAPFIGVFFTKHCMLSSLGMLSNSATVTIVFFCVLLSYLYSYRLCRILITPRCSASLGVMYTCSACSATYWWLFLNSLVCSSLDEFTYASVGSAAVITGFELTACLVCWVAYDSVILANSSSSLFGVDVVVEFCYHVFYTTCEFTSFCLLRWDSRLLSAVKAPAVGSINWGHAVNVILIMSCLVLILMCALV
uniref:NADH:ubiquinone reductase (H(+)-translocating) n=1 Tax=Atractolytocestus huronensis TaxID=507542 RepID=A0A343EST8_9CEST|nr:NADH dehydrogenase subunit 5 [Atractolytocestus huronensis]ASL24624.1 NADH dehydrogenase subunit 5 [Atractolytocestus huronensis]